MDYNPYAPPRPPPPAATVRLAHDPLPWKQGEVLGAAFRVANTRWTVVLPAILLTYGMIFGSVRAATSLSRVMHLGLGDGLVAALPMVACRATLHVVVEGFLMTGLLRILLAAARGQPTSLRVLLSGGDRFIAMTGVICVTSGISILGSVVHNKTVTFTTLLVPDLLVYQGLCFAQYYVVDQNLGTLDALRAAWRDTAGQHGKVLLSAIDAGLVCFGGAALCLVGLLVTGPTALLCFTIMYLRIGGGGALAEEPRAG